MPISALLFDFDGLILDTETPEVEGYRRIYAEYGQEFPDWVWQKMIGYSTPEIYDLPWTALQDLLGRPIDIAAHRARSKALRLDLIMQKPPMDGVLTFLARTAAVRRAVVSSSPREWVEGHLARLGLLHEFEFCICGYEGLPSKPAPDLYLAGLQALRIPPKEVVAVEDSPNGMRAALAAGLRVICVPNDLTRQMDLSIATWRFDTLAQVHSLDQLNAPPLAAQGGEGWGEGV